MLPWLVQNSVSDFRNLTTDARFKVKQDDIFGNLIARSIDLDHKINGAILLKILLREDNGPNDVAKYPTAGHNCFQSEKFSCNLIS